MSQSVKRVDGGTRVSQLPVAAGCDLVTGRMPTFNVLGFYVPRKGDQIRSTI
jgi:hypothetical protein